MPISAGGTGIGESQAELDASEYLEKRRLLDRIGSSADAFAAYDVGKARLRDTTRQACLDTLARCNIDRSVARHHSALGPTCRTRCHREPPLGGVAIQHKTADIPSYRGARQRTSLSRENDGLLFRESKSSMWAYTKSRSVEFCIASMVDRSRSESCI